MPVSKAWQRHFGTDEQGNPLEMMPEPRRWLGRTPKELSRPKAEMIRALVRVRKTLASVLWLLRQSGVPDAAHLERLLWDAHCVLADVHGSIGWKEGDDA